MSRSKALVKPLEERERSELIAMAGKGDEAACKALYARLETEGVLETFVESLTQTAYNARKMRHENLIVEEAFRRKMKQMREDLGASTAAPLERLLIERVVLCWDHLHDIELRYVKQMGESMTLTKATYVQKSLDRAEARYQAAIKSLAVLRRLQLPSVQINIGEKQVNIAGRAGGEGGETSPK